MSEGETRAAAREPTLLPRRRRRWLVMLLMVAVFLFGVVCGGGAALVLVAHRAREMAAHPERRPQQVLRWLTRHLDLTESQQESARALLTEQHQEFMRLRRAAAPEVMARLRKTEEEMNKILNPRQQEKWRLLVARIRNNWLPPELKKEP